MSFELSGVVHLRATGGALEKASQKLTAAKVEDACVTLFFAAESPGAQSDGGCALQLHRKCVPLTTFSLSI